MSLWLWPQKRLKWIFTENDMNDEYAIVDMEGELISAWKKQIDSD